MKKILVISLISAIVIGIGFAAMALLKKKNVARVELPVFEKSRMLPRVLFLTTGTTEGNGEIAEGVSIAVQELTRKGAFVWLGTRDYLLQPEKLGLYNVMVAPTSFDYHDGDRKYSLTYLNDKEMNNIREWVKQGGILLTEENIGRNTLDDVDRLSQGGELNEKNWPLSELFGIRMKEVDLSGFVMLDKSSGIWSGTIKDTVTENEWALIPTETTSKDLRVLAEWKRAEEVYPAVIENRFGSGKAFLLTSTYMLHPSNDGGVSSVEQIEKLYDMVLSSLPGQSEPQYSLSPWPDGFTSAAVITFNSSDDKQRYELISAFIRQESIPSTFVIDSSVTEEIITFLSELPGSELISGLGSRRDFTASSLSDNARAFLDLEQQTGLKFKGVRFPFRSANFAGLTYASQNGYMFDASVGIDHLAGYAGCVFPYNIPLARDSFYKSTDMLELCQVLGNDYDYIRIPDSTEDYTQEIQRENAALYSKYLKDFFRYVSKRNNGLMVYSGNPDYTAYSELTMLSLKGLLDEIKASNTWITTASQVVDYRNRMKGLLIQATQEAGGVVLKFRCLDGSGIEGLTLEMKKRPSDVSADSSYELKELEGKNYLIMDIKDGEEVRIRF